MAIAQSCLSTSQRGRKPLGHGLLCFNAMHLQAIMGRLHEPIQITGHSDSFNRMQFTAGIADM